jgi:AcrR family transcriptional regulator
VLKPTPHAALGQRSQLRGDETRRRMVETAIAMFAERGYDGASTRLLARRARVNLPAIQYHFGGKAGLYRAAIAHIADYIERQMAPVTARVRPTLARNPSRAVTLELLLALMDAFVALVFADSEGDGAERAESRKLFIARAEVERSAALRPLYKSMQGCVGAPCAAVVGRLIGRSPRDRETRLRMVALLGQSTIFCNEPAKQTMGWDTTDPAQMRAVRKIVREHTRAIFTAPAGRGR